MATPALHRVDSPAASPSNEGTEGRRKRARTSLMSEEREDPPRTPDNDDDAPRPDLIAYLSQRSTQAQQAQLELREARERCAARDRTIASLEAARDGLAAENQRLVERITAEHEQRLQAEASVAGRVRREAERVAAAEGELRAALDRLRRAEAAAADAAAADGRADALRGEVSTLKRRVQALEGELAAEKDAGVDARRALERKVAWLEEKRGVDAREVAACRRDVEAARAETAEVRRRLAAAEARAAELERRALVAESASSGGGAAMEEVVRALRAEVERRDAEAEEARRIKERWESTQILRERAESEARRAADLQARLEAAESAASEAAAAAATARAWEDRASKLGIARPADMAAWAADARRDAVAALERLGAADERAAALAVEAEDLRGRVAAAEGRVKLEEGRTDEARAEAARAEARARMLGGECEGLRRVVETYGKESGAAAWAVEREELQRAAEALRARVAELEAGVAEAAAAGASARAEAEAQKTELERASVRVRALERQNDALGREVALLQARLGRGEFDASQTRVLHLRGNPEAAAREAKRREEVERLEAQNEALRAQLREAEAVRVAGGGAGAGGASSEAAVLGAEAIVQKRRAAELEKQMLRLKEVFKERVHAFREACYHLLGYRVDMVAEAVPAGAGTGAAAPTTVSLRPRHGDGKDDLLLFRFKPGSKEGFELVETALSRKYQSTVDLLVERWKNIPAFTANVTTDLCNKMTQC
ncbi:unnamed protein product [Pedinophyceae sp. YPF-701]|nr:unnamed protein product [Pedinophyceae sp. YPF-701]